MRVFAFYKKVYYGWWIVLACFLIAAYVSGGVFLNFTAFFQPVVAEFGWSYTKVSLVSTIRGFEVGVFAFFAGFLVDRFGPRLLVAFGFSTIGLGLLLFSRTSSLFGFFSAFVLMSLGAGGCTSVVLTSVLANWFQQNLGKALGIMACGFGAGGLLVPLVVRLIDVLSWRTTAMVLGVGALVIGLPLSLVLRNRPGPGDRAPEGLEIAPLRPGEKPHSHARPAAFWPAIRSRNFWCFNAAEAIRMLILNAVMMHVMPYLATQGFDRTRAGLITAAIPFVSIIGRFGFGWLGDTLDKRRVLFSTHVLMGLGMLAFALVRVPGLLVPFLFCFSVGYGGSMPLRGLILREYFGLAALGSLLGVSMGLAASGGMVGPVLAGLVYDATGSYLPVWLGSCGLTLVSSTMILFLQKNPLSDWNREQAGR
jgi:MFS family permease